MYETKVRQLFVNFVIYCIVRASFVSCFGKKQNAWTWAWNVKPEMIHTFGRFRRKIIFNQSKSLFLIQNETEISKTLMLQSNLSCNTLFTCLSWVFFSSDELQAFETESPLIIILSPAQNLKSGYLLGHHKTLISLPVRRNINFKSKSVSCMNTFVCNLSF